MKQNTENQLDQDVLNKPQYRHPRGRENGGEEGAKEDVSDKRRSVCLVEDAREDVIVCALIRRDGCRKKKEQWGQDWFPILAESAVSLQLSPEVHLAFPIDEDEPLEDTRCLFVESLESQ
ncbi:unnamed protein product [Hymenolepis diminuta]|uniref:Uncharacterized protein n=1 Tax=Hymenolepis diminuta TaxID=6216 RepID=A0A564YKG9_HYMDI|nr:unnamed protein product [Hymenolepis diminuta]